MFSLFVNVLRFLDFSLYRVYNSGYFSLCLRHQILRYAQDDRDGRGSWRGILYRDVPLYLFPFAYSGGHTSSGDSFGRDDFDSLVDDNPLLLLHLWSLEHLGDADGLGLHRPVGLVELEGDFDVSLHVGQLAEGIERGICHGHFVACACPVLAVLQIEVDAALHLGHQGTVVHTYRTRHTCDEGYGRTHIFHSLDVDLHVVGLGDTLGQRVSPFGFRMVSPPGLDSK